MTCVFLKLWSTLCACAPQLAHSHLCASPSPRPPPNFQPPARTFVSPVLSALHGALPLSHLALSAAGSGVSLLWLLGHACDDQSGCDKGASGTGAEWPIQSECKLCEKRLEESLLL
jgi:hypothetical protein